MDPQALDGNAVAGLLADVFGAEMTNVIGTCATCGSRGEIATFVVYVRTPGTVVRCRTCSALLMALVTIREITCVDLRGLDALERPA